MKLSEAARVCLHTESHDKPPDSVPILSNYQSVRSSLATHSSLCIVHCTSLCHFKLHTNHPSYLISAGHAKSSHLWVKHLRISSEKYKPSSRVVCHVV